MEKEGTWEETTGMGGLNLRSNEHFNYFQTLTTFQVGEPTKTLSYKTKFQQPI